MRVLKMSLVLSSLVAAAACQQNQKAAPDNTLSWLDSLSTQPPAVASATELGTQALAQPVVQPVADEKPTMAALKPAAAHTTTRHTSTATHHRSTRRSSSGSSGTYASSAGTYRAPRVTTVKHTQRDAAIGAGVGAVAGAVAGGGRHRVRGAVIGGVLGGVAGAVIGNNVDKSHRIDY